MWSSIVIPLIGVIFLFFYRPQGHLQSLEKFIDSHLIPYLLVKKNKTERQNLRLKAFVLWGVAWGCLSFALAGPRWNFRETELFSNGQSLVILLDMSRSMNASDIKPSRLARAKQKIEDIPHLATGVKIGLIAFAADPHMITPITEDKETVRHLLNSLETDLMYVQGSKLSPALDMASAMLATEPGNDKAKALLSD